MPDDEAGTNDGPAVANVLEGSTVRLRAGFAKGSLKDPVRWHLTTSTGESEHDGVLDGGAALLDWTLADVPDEAESYTLRYAATFKGKRYEGAEQLVVWPADIKVKATIRNDDRAAEGPPRFKFRARQGPTLIGRGLLTDPEGKGEAWVPVGQAARVTIEADPPWQIDQDDARFLRTRALQVSRRPYTARIHKPLGGRPGDEPHKQWVNLGTDLLVPGQGSALLVEVGAEGDDARPIGERLGAPGDQLFVRVTFDPGNSKRRSFAPHVVAGGVVHEVPEAADGVARVIDLQLQLGADAIGRLVIDCGRAGGDKVRVDVGVTPACADETLHIVTWRRLFLELLAPDSMTLEPCLTDDGQEAKGLPQAVRAELARCLEPAFVELVLHRSGQLPADSVQGALLPAGWLGARELFALTPANVATASLRFGEARTPRALHVRLCDAAFVNDSGPEWKGLELTANELVVEAAQLEAAGGDTLLPTSARALGRPALREARWRAGIRDTSAHQGHPGLQAGEPRGGDLSPGVDVVLESAEKLKVSLPAEPAGLVAAEVSSGRCPIKVMVELEVARRVPWLRVEDAPAEWALACAADAPKATAAALLHLLGHAAGLCTLPAGQGGSLPPAGLGGPTGVDATPAGTVYTGKGHPACGAHCAHGLAESERQRARYVRHTDGATTHEALAGDCVMFGALAATDADLKATGYCPDCLATLKGRELSHIHGRAWSEGEPP
jgi:hypothetical protein